MAYRSRKLFQCTQDFINCLTVPRLFSPIELLIRTDKSYEILQICFKAYKNDIKPSTYCREPIMVLL